MSTHFASVLLIFFFVLPVFAGEAIELNARAEALMAKGSWEEARRSYLKLHATLENTLGRQHPQTVLALANACDASVPLAAQFESLQVCRRALELKEKVSGPDSLETVKTINDLALLYAADGDVTPARKLLERALRITGGDPSSEAAGLMNNLGYLYYKKGKYSQSRDMFERAIAAVGNGVTADGSDLVTMLGNLGTAEMAAHDAASAERHFRQALSIAQESFAPDHVKHIRARNDLSRAQAALGNKVNALTSSAAMP
jgi:tetratricopeptide (TPR) repeat protein